MGSVLLGDCHHRAVCAASLRRSQIQAAVGEVLHDER